MDANVSADQPSDTAGNNSRLTTARRGFLAPRSTNASSSSQVLKPLNRGQVSWKCPAASSSQPSKPASAEPSTLSALGNGYYTVLYTKRAQQKKRKNKQFQDGILQVSTDCICTLFDQEGKVVYKSKVKDTRALPSGSELMIGNWEVEVDEAFEAKKFRSGQCFVTTSTAADASAAVQQRAPGTVAGFRSVAGAAPAQGREKQARPALHNPDADGALVLNRTQWKQAAQTEIDVTAVVVDPYVGRHLQPHQQQGVQFLYDCVMGLREPHSYGAVLADEMGLGKTLQVITLLWTLLKQGPQGKPVLRKAVIVTPSSLTQNWGQEFHKWLGPERLKAVVLQPGAGAVRGALDFQHGSINRVLICSYETLRKFSAQLAGCCDLLVCDEGHRLKSAQGSKTIESLKALGCGARILLTGTPVQNNLEELYAMLTFVNPDSLGSLPVFKRVFGDPISRSRDGNATDDEKQLGQQRLQELSRRIDSFVLRRTSDILSKHLPPLSSYSVFCRPSPLQVKLYATILHSKSVTSILNSAAGGDEVLSIITQMRKLCNHPDLLLPSGFDGFTGIEADDPIHSTFPSNYQCVASCKHSGKLQCLEHILRHVIQVAEDRAVVVSNSTAALNVIQTLCDRHDFKTIRIDGSTNVASRQDIVNSFNNFGVGQVCLLSTRAGGAGLNLVGGNHLILYDLDWNPAADLQAMARVWRDGQKKPTVVYRLLTTGTIDEKIYQRQLMKGEIADMMDARHGSGRGGAGGSGSGFTKEELRELFSLATDTACNTRDLLRNSLSQEHQWKDISGEVTEGALQAAVAAGGVTFVYMKNKTEPILVPPSIADEIEGSEDTADALVTPPAVKSKSGIMAAPASAIDDPSCLEIE